MRERMARRCECKRLSQFPDATDKCAHLEVPDQAKLLETAVEYIQHLQGQVEELRESCHSGHATLSEVDSVAEHVEQYA